MDPRVGVAMAPANYFSRARTAPPPLKKDSNYYAACGLLANLELPCTDINIHKIVAFMNRTKV